MNGLNLIICILQILIWIVHRMARVKDVKITAIDAVLEMDSVKNVTRGIF